MPVLVLVMNIQFKIIVLCLCFVIIGKHGVADNAVCNDGFPVRLAFYHITPNVPLSQAEFEEFKSSLSVDEQTLQLKTDSSQAIKVKGVIGEYIVGREQKTKVVQDGLSYTLRVLISEESMGNRVSVGCYLFYGADMSVTTLRQGFSTRMNLKEKCLRVSEYSGGKDIRDISVIFWVKNQEAKAFQNNGIVEKNHQPVAEKSPEGKESADSNKSDHGQFDQDQLLVISTNDMWQSIQNND